MRLLVPALATLVIAAACGSSGHGGSATGGAGGAAGNSPSGGTGGVSFAQPNLDGATLDDAGTDAALPSSCQIADDGGSSCLQLDPGTGDPDSVCAANGGGPAVAAACPRDSSAGGCHAPVDGGGGYTIWSYAPVSPTAMLLQCARQGETYVSP
jgi:hypothetical protein